MANSAGLLFSAPIKEKYVWMKILFFLFYFSTFYGNWSRSRPCSVERNAIMKRFLTRSPPAKVTYLVANTNGYSPGIFVHKVTFIWRQILSFEGNRNEIWLAEK
jgi:hypothetical protein